MARTNPYRPFTPDPDQMARAPAVSGNAINGLGETEFRRPRMVYWAPDPDDIPHGEMQRWFYTVDKSAPAMVAAQEDRARRIASVSLPEIAPERVTRSPDAWLDALQAFRAEADVDMIGSAPLDLDWLYEGAETGFSRVIMLGVQHDHARISHAPGIEAGAEVITQYGRAMAGAVRVAGWLRRQGWDAEPQTGPMTGKLAMIPAAIACGFGELGKHGSLINAEFGASFRLAAVLTDAPIADTPPREFGVDAFCASCRICEDACPPEAISAGKRTVRGVRKWYVDFDRCLPFFNQTHGCAICIAVCPWSRPGVGLNLAAKLKRRRKRLG
ncbi:MAG: 4Fe-4S dicluster domain-containing protein [Alphaproteobacteria bacterium]|nr:MAG: 4Fe-4S dicluster domain-containing protein [Alphaproteobacteria bacterium]